jgi:Protein of unknown function (DUF2778)
VRGGQLRIIDKCWAAWGVLICLSSGSLFAAIGALAIGFALELPVAPRTGSVSEVIQPKHLDAWDSLGSVSPERSAFRVVSLETVFEATENRDRPSEPATSTWDRTFSAKEIAIDAGGNTFGERFAGAFEFPGSGQFDEQERANSISLGSPELGRRAVSRHVIGQSVPDIPLPTARPVNASKKQLRTAEAPGDLVSPLDADGHTAIYDIGARTVYLPNGEKLEAHSGFGSYLDDPRYVSEKDQGPTPPNVYNLTLREEPFHGVRAIRLLPVGGSNMFGRDGMLAHTYMLGPNGQSNGCLSLRDYPRFLNAFLSGEINRLVVVEQLATTPTAQTAWGWLPGAIKAIFGRS